MAQNRYKRLVMAAEAGQRTVPANEVVFREVNAEKHLGHDRVAPHYVPEEERIPQTIAETRRTHMSVGGGPFSDKMNNMYMQNWHQASYPFVKDRHLKPWNAPEGIHAAEVRGQPARGHGGALTPWRRDDEWAAHQKKSCPGTQRRLAAARTAARADKEQAARRRRNMENHRASVASTDAATVPWRTGYARAQSDLRPTWRTAGRGVMKPRRERRRPEEPADEASAQS